MCRPYANLEVNDSLPIVKSFRECEEAVPVSASALMTQCEVLAEDATSVPTIAEAENLFPVSSDGVTDSSTGDSVLDLRTITSWRKSILPCKDTDETVESVEFLEVLLVNTLAPFILLKSLVGSLKRQKETLSMSRVGRECLLVLDKQSTRTRIVQKLD